MRLFCDALSEFSSGRMEAWNGLHMDLLFRAGITYGVAPGSRRYHGKSRIFMSMKSGY